MADGTCAGFGVLANAWKETVRDAMDNIKANREAAKVKVRRAINQRTTDPAERKRLYIALKTDRWAQDPFLSRMMRNHCRRGHNHTHNQIVVRADQYRCFTLKPGGKVWLTVPGLIPRQMVKILLNTTVVPDGTLRLILRGGRVEVHYQIDAATMPSSERPCGDRLIGVDKGYTEVLTDSDGVHHGPELGRLLTTESDRRKARNARRAKLRSIASSAAATGNKAKATRIVRNNLGTVKRDRRAKVWRSQVRTVTFQAVHAVVSKAATVVAEDLSKPFMGRHQGRNTNRRLAAWTKGVTAEALQSVSERRGSALVLVNAAYTSQVDPDTDTFGVRKGDWLHCASGVVWEADHAAAINILQRYGDPDITLHTPHIRIKQVLQERAGRQRIRLPIQDSSQQTMGGERTIQPCSYLDMSDDLGSSLVFNRLPKKLRPPFSADERVLAWASTTDGQTVVATNLGLWHGGVRRGWHEIAKVDWSLPQLVITPVVVVSERDGYMIIENGAPVVLALEKPGHLPHQVRLRVTSSVVHPHHVDWVGWIAARRIPGKNGLHWIVRPDQPLDDLDAVDDLVAQIACEVVGPPR